MTNQPTPLPVSLFDIIAWVETKNNPHAMRFEPTMYARIATYVNQRGEDKIHDAIRDANACSWGTTDMIYSTSFGATQIMGFNLYDGLYSGDVVAFMGDPIAQAAAFGAFCEKKGLAMDVDVIANSPSSRTIFARVYNGDANVYAPLIVQALKHFGIGVTE